MAIRAPDGANKRSKCPDLPFVAMMKMMLAVEESWFEPDGN